MRDQDVIVDHFWFSLLLVRRLEKMWGITALLQGWTNLLIVVTVDGGDCDLLSSGLKGR